MSEPFLAEIRIVGFNFPPRGWAQCDGQILPINQNQSLYSLLGTTFGGDGRTTFGLPGLQGRVPVHPGNSINWGNKSGTETTTLQLSQTPSHQHTLQASTLDANSIAPTGVLARSTQVAPYRELTNPVAADGIDNVGGGQNHENMQPFQVLNFCIATTGLFPSRN